VTLSVRIDRVLVPADAGPSLVTLREDLERALGRELGALQAAGALGEQAIASTVRRVVAGQLEADR
jgi:hypothetical protein